MSEVHRYQVVRMLSEEGNVISYNPHGPWMVTADAHDAALSALREELAQWKSMVGAVGATIPLSETLASTTTKQTMVDYFKTLHVERDGLRKSLTAAEQRNAILIGVLEMFADNSDDGDVVEISRHHIALSKPTESGASDAQ